MLAQQAAAQVAQPVPPPVQAQPIQIQIQVQPGQPAQIQPVQIQPGVAAKMVMRPNFQRITSPDVVVVGRVVGMEPVDVEASPAAGQAKTNYRIAVLQVNDVLRGVKKDTMMVRVGFIVGAPGANAVGGVQFQPGGAIRRPIAFPGTPNVAVQVGQEGLFMLVKHHKEDFYLLPNFNSFVSSMNNTNYENEVKNAKRLCSVLENTAAALKSDDVEKRSLAAAVLISKYRSNTTGLAVKQEPISAEESKLILKALSTGDWTPNRFNQVPNSYELFNMLGITAADGYNPVNLRTPQQYSEAMQKWVSEHTDKYVIKRLVANGNAQVQPQPVPPQIRPLPPVRVQPGILPVQPNPAPRQGPGQ